jgi:hypothetical protein
VFLTLLIYKFICKPGAAADAYNQEAEAGELSAQARAWLCNETLSQKIFAYAVLFVIRPVR